MSKASDGENQIRELTDLDVETIGLVRRGANRRPFFVLKSEGGNEMADQEEQGFSDILAELEKAEGVTSELLTKVTEGFSALVAQIEAKPEQEPEEEDFADLTAADKSAIMALLDKIGEGKLGGRMFSILKNMAGGARAEQSSDFSEQIETMRAELVEDFAAKIKVAETKAIQAEERADEERNRRRLAEFTDRAKAYPFAIEIEQFAEDLMALEDHDPELYSRWIKRLNALSEQVEKGALFEQFGTAGGETEGVHPFLVEVEKLRKEHHVTEKYAEGFTAAMVMAEQMHPDLAARYELETREVK